MQLSSKNEQTNKSHFLSKTIKPNGCGKFCITYILTILNCDENSVHEFLTEDTKGNAVSTVTHDDHIIILTPHNQQICIYSIYETLLRIINNPNEVTDIKASNNGDIVMTDSRKMFIYDGNFNIKNSTTLDEGCYVIGNDSCEKQ